MYQLDIALLDDDPYFFRVLKVRSRCVFSASVLGVVSKAGGGKPRPYKLWQKRDICRGDPCGRSYSETAPLGYGDEICK
jgi:hypothetical protein